MKIRILNLIALAALAWWTGCASAPTTTSSTAQRPALNAGKAVVRVVKGIAHYSLNGTSVAMKAGMTLPPEAVVLTAPLSEVYLSVNGISSAIRVFESSELALEKMSSVGAGATAQRQTVLNLKNGCIFGQVKRVSNDSSYEVRTPKGVATMRGGDFSVKVERADDGGAHVGVVCVTGLISVSAEINGQPKTVGLHDRQKCVTDGSSLSVVRAKPEDLFNVESQVIYTLSSGPQPPSQP